MKEKYQIAGCVLELKGLDRKQLPERLLPFLIKNNKLPDFIYDFSYVDKIVPDPFEEVIYSDRLSMIVTVDRSEEDKVYLYRVDSNSNILARIREDGSYIHIELPIDSLHYDLHEYFIPDLLHLESFLIKKKAFVLHSSFIEVDGQAILFTARSGGGKSTQADLWQQYRNARIINGDKNIVAYQDGRWMAYGSPMSGSSPYCLNEGYPLKAIVVLEKAPENKVESLGISAYNYLLREIISNPWDEVFMSNLVDLVCDLCGEVPMYYFRCTKTEDAVTCLEREL